jgi:hypothetical protein
MIIAVVLAATLLLQFAHAESYTAEKKTRDKTKIDAKIKNTKTTDKIKPNSSTAKNYSDIAKCDTLKTASDKQTSKKL